MAYYLQVVHVLHTRTDGQSEFQIYWFKRYDLIDWTYLYIVGSKKNQLPPMDTKPSSEDILNAILPPREWVESGKHYIQYVSH